MRDGGPKYAVYIRKTDGSPAIRLGEGNGLSLSPDGKWALARLNSTLSPLILFANWCWRNEAH